MQKSRCFSKDPRVAKKEKEGNFPTFYGVRGQREIPIKLISRKALFRAKTSFVGLLKSGGAIMKDQKFKITPCRREDLLFDINVSP